MWYEFTYKQVNYFWLDVIVCCNNIYHCRPVSEIQGIEWTTVFILKTIILHLINFLVPYLSPLS